MTPTEQLEILMTVNDARRALAREVRELRKLKALLTPLAERVPDPRWKASAQHD